MEVLRAFLSKNSSLSLHFCCSFCCKKVLYGLVCWKQKERKSDDGNAFNAYPLLSCHIFLASLSILFTLPFSYTLYFQYKNTHGKGSGDTSLGIRQSLVWSTPLTHYLSILIWFGRFSVELLNFFEHDLTFFPCSFHDISDRHPDNNLIWQASRSLIPRGHEFNPHILMLYASFSFSELF